MIFGKNREQGSMALTGVVAVGMLALATMFAQQSSQQAKQFVEEAKNTRGREAASIGAENTLSRFKALLSGRNVGPGKYIPAVFAENYYELLEWKLMEGLPSDTYSFQNAKSGAVKIAQQNVDVARTSEIMAGSKITGTAENFRIDVIKPNFQLDPSKPGYRKVVTSVDVNVTGTTTENGVSKTSKVSARIPLPPPKPYDVKLKYRTAGSVAPPQDVVSGTTLPSGSYEFFIFASGVVYDARLFLNDQPQPAVGGFDPATGLISHQATNYAAKEIQIGTKMSVNMQAEAPAPTAEEIAALAAAASATSSTSSAGGDWAPDSFNQSTCSFIEGGGTGGSGGAAAATSVTVTPPFVPTVKTFKIRAVAYGPDESEDMAGTTPDLEIKIEAPPPPPVTVSTAPTTNQTGGGGRLTQDDYANLCAAENACTWVPNDPGNGSELGRVASYFRPTGDISSYYTFKQGQDDGKWGIFNKKVCFNFANADNSNHDLQFSDADVVTYDVTNCKRQVLFKRTTCGCVTADTEIVMEDGKSTKRIDQIVDTDLIWNPLLKKALPIRKMTVGPEKIPMLKIGVAGREIKATGKHPFVTRKGILPAFELEEGQEIMIDAGIFAKISTLEGIPVAAGELAPNVWNIELEAPNDDHTAHHFVANGITTGDLMIQMKLESGLIKK